MSRFNLPNLPYIRQDDKYYEQTFRAVEQAVNRMSDQGNLDPTGAQLATPPQIGGVSVVESGGIHDIQITDNSPAYNGLQYSAEYSRTSDFQNAHRIDMGESQNHRANLGSGPYFWRAYSKYSASLPSNPLYHGGETPVAVGSGEHAGPPMQTGMGFTGIYRNSSVPPVRK